MKNKLRIIAAIALTGLALPLLGSFAAAPAAATADHAGADAYQSYLGFEDGAKTYDFNADWQFYEAKTDDEDYSKNAVDNAKVWKDVTLPHDIDHDRDYTYKGEQESGFFESAYGWYRKSFAVPASLAEKTISLQFDGSYMITDVYLNGTHLGTHYNGYAAFAFDLTGLVKTDGSLNTLAIKVKNEIPSSRWYSGAGLFRDVKLRITDRLHFAYQGIRHQTPSLNLTLGEGYANVVTDYDVANQQTAVSRFKIQTTVFDADGKAVGTSLSDAFSLGGNERKTLSVATRVDGPRLWSTTDPYRYSVTSELIPENGGEALDEATTRLGFKYTNWDSDKGFFLNGQFLELHGVALHHDLGPVGAANFYDAQYRQIQKMKEMGVNAIRTSHNPPSQNFLDICDELGILVIAEAFDGFTASRDSNYNDYARFFGKAIGEGSRIENGSADMLWAEFDLKSMVKKAMNHPSVFAISIGNEVFQAATWTDTAVQSEFPDIARSLVRWVRDIDTTRHVTMGENQDKQASNSDSNYKGVRDVLYRNNGAFGINYAGDWTYDTAHRNQPNLPIYESEGASAIATRAYYKTLKQDNDAKLVTGYDTYHVSWGTSADTAIRAAAERDFVAGTFIWTGWDYIGEPTPWNITNRLGWNGKDPKSSSFGIVDTAGFPKDPYYKYQAQWRKDGKTTLQLLPSWNKEDLRIDNDGNVRVDVYTNAHKVELYLNGKLVKTGFMNKQVTPMGNVYYTQSGSDNTENSLELSFDIPYEEGELKAVAYDELGNVIPDDSIEGRTSVKTTKAASKIVLKADKTETLADGSHLVYVDTTVLDSNGDLVENAQNDIHYEIEGPGVLEGTDNGRPTDFRPFTSPDRQLWAGKGVAVIRTTEDPGQITLKATSDGLESASVSVESKARTDSPVKVKTPKDYWFRKEDVIALDDKASVYRNGELLGEYAIAWDALPNANEGGSHLVQGSVSLEGETIPVTATVHIASQGFVGATNVSLMAVKGQYPVLPSTVDGITETGEIGESLPVTWEPFDFGKAETGDLLTINGVATSRYDGKTFDVTASVRIADGMAKSQTVDKGSIASVTASPEIAGQSTDVLFDGKHSGVSGYDAASADSRVTLTAPTDGKATLQFDFNKAQTINTIDIWFVDGLLAKEGISFQYQTESGGEWKDYSMATYLIQSEDKGATSFGNPVQSIRATAVRIGMEPASGTQIGISEIAFSNVAGLTESSDASVKATYQGQTIAFQSDNKATVSKGKGDPKSLVVSSLSNAGLTVVHLDGKSVIYVLSEDGLTLNTYEIVWTD